MAESSLVVILKEYSWLGVRTLSGSDQFIVLLGEDVDTVHAAISVYPSILNTDGIVSVIFNHFAMPHPTFLTVIVQLIASPSPKDHLSALLVTRRSG